MHIKVFHIFGMISLMLGVLCWGLYLGSRIEKNDQAFAETRAEFVQTIAVVNLDDGIMQGQYPIYYANDFLIFPNSNFIITGLEDARQGIYQGRYAAYVIIPASFSKTIDSINGIPQKSTLEYSVNPHLDAGIKGEAVSDIQQFQMLLNTNISYVYVNAILDEFHDSQNASAVVLKNDKNELEKISMIEAEKLIWNLTFSELEFAEYFSEDLDVADSFADSGQLIEKMGDDILLNIRAGQDEFEFITDQDDDFINASNEMFEYLDEIVPGEDSAGNLVYEDGLIELEREIDTYHTNLSLIRTVIANRLYQVTDEYRTEGGEYLDGRITELQEEVNSQVALLTSQMQEDVDEALQDIQRNNLAIIQEQLVLMQQERAEEYEWIQNYINQHMELLLIEIKEIYEDDANQQMQEILIDLGLSTPSNATPSDAIPSEDDILAAVDSFAEPFQIHLATVSNATINIGDSGMPAASITDRVFPLKNAVSAAMENRDPSTDIWIALQVMTVFFPENYFILPASNFELYQALAAEIGALYHISTNEIMVILQEQVIGEIEQQNDAHKTGIEQLVDKLRDKMDDYEKSIEDFDPYIYVHINDISSVIREVEGNLSVVDRMVYEKSFQDSESVDTAYELIDKNAGILMTDIENANAETLANILTAIDELQTSRINTNEENTYLLEEFSRKLSYTRLGSVGNKEAYDFIVRPILMDSKTSAGKPSLALNAQPASTQLGKCLLLGACLMIASACGMAISFFAWRKKKHK